jgi:antitoxin PrlF
VCFTSLKYRRDCRRSVPDYVKIKNFLIFLKSINIAKDHHVIRTIMAKKNSSAGIAPSGSECGCTPGTGCKVEAVLSIDDRGQMVLPKDVRERAGIKTGDKLALIIWEKNGSVCCLALMKVENLSGMVKDVLGPILHESN